MSVVYASQRNRSTAGLEIVAGIWCFKPVRGKPQAGDMLDDAFAVRCRSIDAEGEVSSRVVISVLIPFFLGFALHRFASDGPTELRRLGFPGPWVKHSPPKRLRNTSAVAVSVKQNRIWNWSTSCRFRPRRPGMRRSRWNASISRKTLRKPPGGNVSSTRCGKSRSFVRPMISRLRRVILHDAPSTGYGKLTGNRPNPYDYLCDLF